MQEISSEVAFWIFDAWQRMASHLQVKGTRSGSSLASEAGMRWTDPKDSKIALELVDDKGQKHEWRVPLADAKFSFGTRLGLATPAFPDFGGGIWLAFLLAEFPDGSQLLFAERFVEPE